LKKIILMPDENGEIVALLHELLELEKQRTSRAARASRFYLIGIVIFFVALTAIEYYFQKQIYAHYLSTAPIVRSSADSLWQNATDGAWLLASPGSCSNCRGPFYHRFFTKEGCEGALAEWNAALNEQRMRQAKGPISAYAIRVLGNCEAHPLRP
jgi:hypothetical protein